MSNCAANAYYLVNNYNLGYKADGTLSNPGHDPTRSPYLRYPRRCGTSATRYLPEA